MREDGPLSLRVTGSGQFRARLTQVNIAPLALVSRRRIPLADRLCRGAGGHAPRHTCPSGIDQRRSGTGWRCGWAGLLALGPGQRVHARSDGSCQWGAIRLPVEELRPIWGRSEGEQRLHSCLPRSDTVATRRGQLCGNCAISIKQQSVPPRLGQECLLTGRAAHGLGAANDPCPGRMRYRWRRSMRKQKPPAGIAASSPVSRICSRPNHFPALAKWGQRSACRARCCANAAGRIWAWARAVPVASAECSWRAARCASKTPVRQAYRQSPADTASVIPAVLL